MVNSNVSEKSSTDALFSAPVIACIIAFAILVILYIPGVLGYPGDEHIDSSDMTANIKNVNDANQILRDRISQLKQAIEAEVCIKEGEFKTPYGPLPSEILSAIPGPPPMITKPMSSATSHIADFSGTLEDLVVNSTVIVMVKDSNGSKKIGSGAFVSADTIVTNSHVVEGEDPRTFEVLNKHIGVKSAVLIAEGQYKSGKQPDLAFLRVKVSPGQPFLALATGKGGQNVMSATFPGIYLERNVSFRTMLSDPDHKPGALKPFLDVQILNAVYPEADGTEYILHTAFIDKGSSGGPLVDTCGRLVGVNVGSISSEAKRPLFFRASYSSSLGRFATDVGITPLTRDDTACTS